MKAPPVARAYNGLVVARSTKGASRWFSRQPLGSLKQGSPCTGRAWFEVGIWRRRMTNNQHVQTFWDVPRRSLGSRLPGIAGLTASHARNVSAEPGLEEMDRTCGGARGSVRCYSQFSNQRFWLEPCFCAAPEMSAVAAWRRSVGADNEPVDGEFRKVMHLSSAGVTEHQRVGCASPSALFLLADPLADWVFDIAQDGIMRILSSRWWTSLRNH